MIVLYFIILLAVVSRFVPHMANFAPLTAIAMFAAYHLDWKKAAGLTFVARLVSDLFLGFFSWPLMLAVYLSHLAGVFLGTWMKKSESFGGVKILSASLSGSIIFFLLTNFAFLYSQYPHNLSGVIQAYVNGLPFFRGTLLGDLFYSFALFGGYEFARLYKQSALIINPKSST
jgi:uncharacterized membrane-anchored protein YitT (DUF2179 family)